MKMLTSPAIPNHLHEKSTVYLPPYMTSGTDRGWLIHPLLEGQYQGHWDNVWLIRKQATFDRLWHFLHPQNPSGENLPKPNVLFFRESVMVIALRPSSNIALEASRLVWILSDPIYRRLKLGLRRGGPLDNPSPQNPHQGMEKRVTPWLLMIIDKKVAHHLPQLLLLQETSPLVIVKWAD